MQCSSRFSISVCGDAIGISAYTYTQMLAYEEIIRDVFLGLFSFICIVQLSYVVLLIVLIT